AVADEIGVGIRPRVLLFSAGPASIALAMPIVYYPPMSKRDGEDWVYTDPQIRVDFQLPRGIRVYAGAGVVLAACTDSIGAVLRGEEHQEPAGHRPMVGGIWTTAHIGGAIPVTPSLDVTFDGGMVLGGMTPRVEYAQRVGIPVLAELGINKSF